MGIRGLILIVILLLAYTCKCECGHAHDHEDDIRKGKEKWFKPPEEGTADHDQSHDHAHAHPPHEHSHDHDHHDHHSHHHHDHHGHHHHDHHDHHHHDGHHHDHSNQKSSHSHSHHQPKKPYKKVRTFAQTIDLWWQAIFATILISAAPFAILFFVPLESNAEAYQPLLKVLLSFASGGLLGDAFLHLIPHAIHPHNHGEHSHDHTHSHSHDHEHSHHDHSETTIVGLWVLAGIVTFLGVEKFVRHVKGGHHHHHHHSDNTKAKESDDEKENTNESKEDKKGTAGDDGNSDDKKVKKRKNKDELTQESKEEKKSKKTEETEEHDGMKVAGYLNLAADFTHNFTDGLAIGASFLGGQTLGMITTATILLHEVPHEIGDFAILIQSGCSKTKAMFLQLSTATGAMAGCILGLLAENIGESAVSWILPFTGGGFIYIATVSVIPELLEDSSPKQTVKEVVAMLVGIGMMVAISVLE